MLLTWIILIPILGGLLAWMVSGYSKPAARWISLLACVADFLLSIYIWAGSPVDVGKSGLILEQNNQWIPQFGISYHLAMDGFSLLLVVLTGLLGAIAVAISWNEITEKVGSFHFALLALLSGVMGVFLAYDLVLFYFFWELMLIPMYFLIGLWGHENRVYAAVKFFIFTFLSGVFMLLAIIGLYIAHGRATGVYTFDYLTILASVASNPYSIWLMLGFFVAFAVKLPAVPIHSWLPDAHTEAPTAGSLILAGLLLKTGAYGIMRFAIPLFPSASSDIRTAAMVIGTVGVLYGAVCAYSQKDFKRMVAYTSVSHMGFILIGAYAGTEMALQGVVIQILSHGISTGALFILAGIIQERTHTRDFDKLGGLWATTPKLGGFLLLFALASLGLPAMGNFVGEFMILLGTYQVNPIITIIASTGFVFSAVYALKLVQMSIFGKNENSWDVNDLNTREIVTLAILSIVILWLGLFPQPIFNTAKQSLIAIQQSVTSSGDQESGITR